MPPLWVIGAQGDGQLVNYRVSGNYMIVDRLFAAAELRLGADPQADRPHRAHRREEAVMTEEPHAPAERPEQQEPEAEPPRHSRRKRVHTLTRCGCSSERPA